MSKIILEVCRVMLIQIKMVEVVLYIMVVILCMGVPNLMYITAVRWDQHQHNNHDHYSHRRH